MKNPLTAERLGDCEQSGTLLLRISPIKTIRFSVLRRRRMPQKVGSEAEASRPRLQGRRRSERDFLRKRRSKGAM